MSPPVYTSLVPVAARAVAVQLTALFHHSVVVAAVVVADVNDEVDLTVSRQVHIRFTAIAVLYPLLCKSTLPLGH